MVLQSGFTSKHDILVDIRGISWIFMDMWGFNIIVNFISYGRKPVDSGGISDYREKGL